MTLHINTDIKEYIDLDDLDHYKEFPLYEDDQDNIQLLSETMGFETKSTNLYCDALLQIAANCNIPFNKSSPDYINIKEDLDKHYANCINEYDAQINATGALDMPTLTVGERLLENSRQIESLRSNPFVHSKIQLRNALDAAYAVESYLLTLPLGELCDEEELAAITSAVKYEIDFDETAPDFEEMRKDILECELMISWLNKQYIADTTGLNFNEIKELYYGNDGEYNRQPRYHTPYSRAWGY